MCLSTVYMDEKTENCIALQDAAELFTKDGAITIRTLFGEARTFTGYVIREMSLTEGFIILGKEAVRHA